MKLSSLLRPVLFASAILVSAAVLSNQAEAKEQKIRSAHFLKQALEAKGFKVGDIRRKAQLYAIDVSKDGYDAILAVDGYSAKIVGINIKSAPAGVEVKKAADAPKELTITKEYGYQIEETTFESYSEVTTEEVSTSESFEETNFESSEEVNYEHEQVSDELDLDQGSAEDAAGDSEADAEE